MTQTISRLNKPGLILSERAIYSNYLVMSYGSDGRDSWIRVGSIPEVLALSQHRACGAEDGERHKRFQKSLRSSGYARWPGIALRWAAALATRPFLTITESALQSPVVNWAEIRHCARGIQAQRVQAVTRAWDSPGTSPVLILSKSVTWPGLKGCLSGKEE